MEGITKLLPLAVRQQLRSSEDSLLELLSALWASIVGRGIAKQAKPVAFAGGTLTIATSCPTWAIQFRQLGEEIRGAINRFLGAELVKRLRVRIDPSVDALDAQRTRHAHPPADHVKADAPEAVLDVSAIVHRSRTKYFARGSQKSH